MNIPVVFGTDQNYLPYMMVAVESIIRNANNDDTYSIFVLYEELDDSDINVVNTFMKSERQTKGKKVFLEFVGVKEYTASLGLTDPGRGWSVASYYRFLIPQLFPQFDQVIYLDCDTLCNSDVSKLYCSPKWENGEYIAAVEDVYCENYYHKDIYEHRDYFERVLKIDDRGRVHRFYFNAGVLVLNCNTLRTAGIMPDMMEAVKGYFKYIDQDVFNIFCKDRVEWLDYRWNTMCDLEDSVCLSEEMKTTICEALKDPGILHYTVHKPWKLIKSKNECHMKELWWTAARETPFYEEIFNGYLSDIVEEERQKKQFKSRMKAKMQKSKPGRAILSTYSRIMKKIVKRKSRRP